ncbi:caspase-2 isoform X2 [Scleropages formosus]|uniref:caspase-2 isoform X2 n=1 Tax=Scleropages formosus TaxID=113540 RepID=UPI0010FAC23E|nr:caspase-2 isoform X2 [Scleropages formosus]
MTRLPPAVPRCSMLGQCRMQDGERWALRTCTAALGDQLVVDEHLVQILLADGIITESMAEAILVEPTSRKKCWRLLSLLPKRGPRAFSSFCAALRTTEQQHLCNLLMDHIQRNAENSVESSLPLGIQEDAVRAKIPRTNESLAMCLDADSPVTKAVLPCAPDFYISHCKRAYTMISSPRGLALVISNVTFDPTLPELVDRVGGDVDEDELRRVFAELDFRVTVARNLTAQGMRNCIEQFRDRPDHQAANSCVVCLLSHGVEGAVYGADGQLLENKPKMFFIQACRGEEMDNGVDQSDGTDRMQSPGCDEMEAGREEGQGNGVKGERVQERLQVKLPQRSDMICGFATLKGTAAMRNTKKGSWYIQELTMTLRQRAMDTHLSDILVQVNAHIKEREGYAPGTQYHRCKEMSEFTSSLCKDLYLFPKYYPKH